MNYKDKTADEIVSNKLVDHSSWHFFQARSWIDLAKRSRRVSPLHYAAFELRYGIEYLLFQLLVLTKKELIESEYKKCLGNPNKMKRLLKDGERPYQKLARFTKLANSLITDIPNLVYWDLSELFQYWGKASKYLHFVGAQIHTYNSEEWTNSSIEEIDKIIEAIWKKTDHTIGIGLYNPDQMHPLVKEIWLDFLSGNITDDSVLFRLELIKPHINT